ncbi:MAG: acyl-CoA thioesterase [Candidatus Omnitrophica bacterium]|nr:acyl-CoA thioesterase [Candidatus Omnitrophota bacterium]
MVENATEKRFFDCEIRVRYGETDCMGFSYYANYFVWFEASRSELFRHLGLPYTELEKQKIYLPVADAYCKYNTSTSYDERIFIRVAVTQCKMFSMKFSYQVLNEKKDQILAWGYTTHVFIDDKKQTVKVPAEVKALVTLYELSEKTID